MLGLTLFIFPANIIVIIKRDCPNVTHISPLSVGFCSKAPTARRLAYAASANATLSFAVNYGTLPVNSLGKVYVMSVDFQVVPMNGGDGESRTRVLSIFITNRQRLCICYNKLCSKSQDIF